jgi:hypothetical protein
MQKDEEKVKKKMKSSLCYGFDQNNDDESQWKFPAFLSNKTK